MESLDVLNDLKRTEMRGKKVNNEWDEWKRLMKLDKNTDSEYQQILYFISEMHEQHTRLRNDIICIDDNDDEEDGKTSIVETAKNEVRDLVIYDPKKVLEDERKLITYDEQKAVRSKQKLDNRAAIVSNKRARSGKPPKTQNQTRSNAVAKTDNKLVIHCRPALKFSPQNSMKNRKMAKGKKVKKEKKADAIQIYDQHLRGPADKGKNVIIVDTDNDEVEILDNALVIYQGMLSPFVPATRYDTSMVDAQDRGGPTASDEFRKEVLKVLREPNDKEECNRLLQQIRSGTYLKHHPDLRRKLSNRKCKPEKRLTILRGFFFWVQNLSREGSFKPWNDRQCLAVKPQSR